MDWASIILATFLIGVGITVMILVAMVMYKLFFQLYPAESSTAQKINLPQEMERNMKAEAIGDFPLVHESIDSVGQSAKNYLKGHPIYVIAGIVIVVFFYAILFVFNVQYAQIYVIPAYLLLSGYLYLLKRVRHEFMRQFAAANGFSYTAKGTLEGLAGTLFQIGRNKSVSDIVSGKYRDCPVSIFSYRYTTEQGKSSQVHNFTIFLFQLNANMPDIILENKNHDFGESFFDTPISGVPLTLEGDFNNYFNLKVPEGFEIEALELFSPNVMVDLEEKCRSLSLEVVGNQLYIYKDGEVNSKKDLYALYGCALYFEEKLSPVLSRMKRSLDAMKSVS
jgi:hypothetical protein